MKIPNRKPAILHLASTRRHTRPPTRHVGGSNLCFFLLNTVCLFTTNVSVALFQVSHHPPAAAHHVISDRGWTLRQEITVASKFRGKYLSIMPLGTIHSGSKHFKYALWFNDDFDRGCAVNIAVTSLWTKQKQQTKQCRSIHPPVSKAWGIQQSHLSLTEGCQSEAKNNKLLFC